MTAQWRARDIRAMQVEMENRNDQRVQEGLIGPPHFEKTKEIKIIQIQSLNAQLPKNTTFIVREGEVTKLHEIEFLSMDSSGTLIHEQNPLCGSCDICSKPFTPTSNKECGFCSKRLCLLHAKRAFYQDDTLEKRYCPLHVRLMFFVGLGRMIGKGITYLVRQLP